MGTVALDNQAFIKKLIWASLICFFAAAILLLRLWFLQILHGTYYRDKSENNRTRTVRTIPPRGNIYDRNGRTIVTNRPSFNIAVILEDVEDLESLLQEVSAISGEPHEELRRRIKSEAKRRPFEPRIILPDVDKELLAKIKVNSYKLPGVGVTVIPTRSYPENNLAVQTLGYAREITREQLDALQDSGYKPGDYIGQSGLEKTFEEVLRGQSGYIEVEVDARGNRKGELGLIQDKPGHDLTLSLDIDLQRAAQEALIASGHSGAVVALDPRNGEILVLASEPSFDANVFSGAMKLNEWKDISGNPKKPLTNRAIANTYPPGSTIKLLYSLAGLNEKIITPTSSVNCPGHYMFAGRPYRCHKKGGHGAISLKDSVMLSCNVFFYSLGQKLGLSNITKYTTDFGFGSPTGIELSGEEAGVAPSEEWKRKRFKEKWYPGDTLPVSIGQGYLVVTPLQMAHYMGALATEGKLFQPHVVKKKYDVAHEQDVDVMPRLERSLEISHEAFQAVKEAALEVVMNQRGTGKKSQLPGVLVAGKTGTAQVAGLGKASKDNKELEDHAWFIAMAPVENPTIAIAAVVENGGHGGATAAPVVRQVLEVYFRKLGMLQEEVEDLSVKLEEEQTEQTTSD